LVIFAELLAKPRRLDAHDGVDGRVEAVRPVKHRQGDVVALELVAPASERLVDDVFEEALSTPRLLKRSAGENAGELLADGLLLGFAPVIERNDRHAPTPIARDDGALERQSGPLILLHTRPIGHELSPWRIDQPKRGRSSS